MSEGEAAFALVKLHGGNAKVHHDPVHTLPADFLQEFGALQIGCVHYTRALAEWTEALPGELDCQGIKVQCQEFTVRRALGQDAFRMTASTGSAIQVTFRA